MTVSALDSNGDWTFGNGRANYLVTSQRVRQNVKTRILSFRNDWLYDTEAEIDWFNILGNRSNEQTILREVERVALATDGVKTIEQLSVVVDRANRQAEIVLSYTDIYDESFTESIGRDAGSC